MNMKRNIRGIVTALLIASSGTVYARDYTFDHTISRPVLENYLSRSITMLDLLTGHGNVDDNIRMLTNVGAKFAGRTIYLWGGESQLPAKLTAARHNANKVHAADREMILQAAVFEIVSHEVSQIPIPSWVFTAFDQRAEQRNFHYEEMLYPAGRGHNHWGRQASIPDVSQQETQRWFFYLGCFLHRSRLRGDSFRTSRDYGRP